MAPTVSVSRTRPQAWLLVADDGFGRAVADAVEACGAPVTRASVTADVESRAFAVGRGVIRVMARPNHAALARVDADAHARGGTWLPVLLDAEVLKVGPLIAAGRSACYRCSVTRWMQHAKNATVLRQMSDSDGATPDGDPGWLPWHATVAGALVAAAVREVECTAGRIWSVNLQTIEVSSARVVGCHGCPRCSEAELTGPDSSHLADELHAQRSSVAS